jgi:hypothetical protein
MVGIDPQDARQHMGEAQEPAEPVAADGAAMEAEDHQKQQRAAKQQRAVEIAQYVCHRKIVPRRFAASL